MDLDESAAVAIDIVRKVEVATLDGRNSWGSGFVVGGDRLITNAHVVQPDGKQARSIRVLARDGSTLEGTVVKVNVDRDVAILSVRHGRPGAQLEPGLPSVGERVVFAGQPTGVLQLSVFEGLVSATGENLLPRPAGPLIQLAGMINNGNSGGPVLSARTGRVIGVITAKYVPMLEKRDELIQFVKSVPQQARGTAIDNVDFAAFLNFNLKAMGHLAGVLRLVQVGTGWAVPIKTVMEELQP